MIKKIIPLVAIAALLLSMTWQTVFATTQSWDFSSSTGIYIDDTSTTTISDGVAKLKPSEFEFQINDEDDIGQYVPQVIELSSGNILYAWGSSDTTHGGTDTDSSHIAAKVMAPDRSVIIPEFQVNVLSAGSQGDVQILEMSNGNVVFTWASRDMTGPDTSGYHIAGRVLTMDEGSHTVIPVGTEFTVNEYTLNDQLKPQVIELSSNQLLFAWHTASGTFYPGQGYEAVARLLDLDGAPLAGEFIINDQYNGHQQDVQLIQLADGNIVFTWTSGDLYTPWPDDSSYYVAAKMYNSNLSSVVVPEFQVNTALILGTQSYPQVLQLSDSNIVFTWESSVDTSSYIGTDRFGTAIIAKRFDSSLTSTLTSEFQVNTYVGPATTSGFQVRAQLFQNNDGNIVFMWESANTTGPGNDNSDYHISSKFYSSSMSEVKSEFQVNYFTSYKQEDIQAVELSDGTVVYTWVSWDSSNRHIASIMYNSDDDRIGQYTTQEDFIQNTVPINYATSITGFTETLSTSNQGSVKYQVKPDSGLIWYYWNGSAWTATISTDTTYASTASDISTNIASLDTDGGQFYWRAYFISDGAQLVELDQIDVDYAGNEDPTDINLTSSTIAENESSGTTIGTLSTTDPDVGDSHTYSLGCTSPGVDDSYFQISSDDLQSNAIFDYESPQDDNTDNDYEICIQTDDGNGGTYDENLTITVTDVNDDPTDISLSASVLNENEASATVIGALSTTDPDTGDSHTYSLGCSTPGGDDAYFQIATSNLEAAVQLNYEDPEDANADNDYEICIQADDGNGGTYDKNFTITVTNVNEPPVTPQQYAISIAEDSANGTTIGTINGTDPEHDSITYTIVSGNNSDVFAINASTGVITLNNNTTLDHEKYPSYLLTTGVSDAEFTVTQAVTIYITDVNEIPVFEKEYSFEIAENIAKGASVGTIHATDPEEQALAYAITAGNTDNVFTINASTGEISINNNDPLDRENTPTYNLTTQASDGTFTPTQEVTINVTEPDKSETTTIQQPTLPQTGFDSGMKLLFIVTAFCIVAGLAFSTIGTTQRIQKNGKNKQN